MNQTKPKKIKTTVNNYINCYKKGIKSFSEIKIPDTVISIDVSGNPLLTSFEGLSKFLQMTSLKANGTKINSFKGAQLQPSLLSISLLYTPLSKEKHLILMALLTFGHSLRNVNGKMVPPNVRQIALQIRSKTIPYLERGYLISQVEPQLKVHLPGSNEDIIVDMDIDEFLEKEKLVKDNDKTIQEMRERLLLLQKEKKEKKLAKVDQKKIIDSFINQSPRRTPPRKNKTTKKKISTTNNSDNAYQNQININVDSPTQANKKQTTRLNNKENRNQNQGGENALLNKIDTKDQNKQKKDQNYNTNQNEEESPIFPTFEDQQEDYEKIFNFSDDEKNEEESPIMNDKPKNLIPSSNDFPDDDQLIDYGHQSPMMNDTPMNLIPTSNDSPVDVQSPNKLSNGDIDQDLYNDLMDNDNDQNNEDQINLKENITSANEEEEVSQINEFKNEEGEFSPIKEIKNDEDEISPIKDIENEEDEKILNLSEINEEEDEEEEDPSISAIRADMNSKQNYFIPKNDYPSDDELVDINLFD